MWICSKGLIDRCSFLVADFFFFFCWNPPVCYSYYFCPWRFGWRGLLCRIAIQVYTYYSWKDWIVFSLISNWLMLLAWWGLQWWGSSIKQQSVLWEETFPVVFILFPVLPHLIFFPFFFCLFVILVEVNTCMVLCWAISFFLTTLICRIELLFKRN